MKVVAISLNSNLSMLENNYNKAVLKIKESLRYKPDVIMLPELFSTAFFPKNIENYAEECGDKIKYIMGNLAKEYGVNIVAGSVANRIDKEIYNTSFIFNRNGENIAQYSKVHLFSYMNEDDYFKSGDKIVTFEIDGIKCGIIICYDLRFVEFVRTLALKDICILFIVSSWPLSRLSHLHTLAIARAIENQFFVALCNASSLVNKIKFAGNSLFIDPLGNILAKGDFEEDIICADFDFSQLKDIRDSINIYKDRKKHLYKI